MMRIATNRDFILEGSVEYIELDSNGVFFWKGEDELFDSGFSFPVQLWFVEEFFEKIGRKLDRSRLPANIVKDPYAQFL